MKKLIKFVLIGGGAVLGLFVLLLIVAAIAIPILLPPAKMKAMATDKISAAIHHKVALGDIHFNVFTGFDVKNLKIENRSGAGWSERPFLAAKDISISYHLLPLLWGQVSLGEIVINQPDILVERKGLNSFNFSDMLGGETAPSAPESAPAPKAPPKAHKKTKRHAELPVVRETQEASGSFFVGQAWADTTQPSAPAKKSSMNISVDGLNILHGKLVYLDETASPAQRYDLKDLNFHVKNISMEGGKSTFSMSTPLEAQGLKYQLSMGGSFRFFMSSLSIKALDLTGSVNDQGFKLSGDADTISDNLTPNMDGEASLDMLKFSGLLPRKLYSMPPGLSLTGPAKVDFHLGGNQKNGWELTGTADGSDLVIQYQDSYAKTAKTTCKVVFKSVIGQNFFNVPSFQLLYQEWEVDGTYQHPASGPWTCQVHSKDLPLKGLSNMLPRLKTAAFGGDVAVNVTLEESQGKATPFSYNGQIPLKDVSVSLPQEPYLQKLNSVVYLGGNTIRVPLSNFQSFDGTGAAGVTVNMGALPNYGYAVRLTGVNAQKAVDASIDAYVAKKDYSTYKDTLYGTLNLAYAGQGKGFGDNMLATQAGGGTYSMANAKVKGLAAVKAINQVFKDPSDEISFDKIDGTLSMKSGITSFTANTAGKVGAFRAAGGINGDGIYTPDLKVQCDIKREFLNSDRVQGLIKDKLGNQIPPQYVNQVLDWAQDDQGNIPVDFRLTGPASKVPGLDCVDMTRATHNVLKHLGDELKKAAGTALQQGAQDLGNKIKGLFGH